jgi:hypothetical protein
MNRKIAAVIAAGAIALGVGAVAATSSGPSTGLPASSTVPTAATMTTGATSSQPQISTQNGTAPSATGATQNGTVQSAAGATQTAAVPSQMGTAQNGMVAQAQQKSVAMRTQAQVAGSKMAASAKASAAPVTHGMGGAMKTVTGNQNGG